MNKEIKYVPILKGKSGEFSALKKLEVKDKNKLIPLIEVIDIPWDYKNNKLSKTASEHVEKLVDNLVDCWGLDLPIFLDLPKSLKLENVKNGDGLLTHIFKEANSKKINLIPVIGVKDELSYINQVKTILKRDSLGVCLRLEAIDLGGKNLNVEMDSLLKSLSIKPQDVDLVLDLKEILPYQKSTTILALKQVILSIPHLSTWRSVTFIASSFPKDLSGLTGSKSIDIHRLPRIEWLVWKSINSDKSIPVKINYGDYCISNPEMNKIDPRIMTMSASVRYTTEEEWIVFKAKSIKKEGFEQYHSLAKAITSTKEYKGKDFSAGDLYIDECSKRNKKPGSATTWRFVGTNHHIKLVIEQIGK